MLVKVSKMPTHPQSTLANLIVPQLCVKNESPEFSGEKKKN